MGPRLFNRLTLIFSTVASSLGVTTVFRLTRDTISSSENFPEYHKLPSSSLSQSVRFPGLSFQVLLRSSQSPLAKWSGLSSFARRWTANWSVCCVIILSNHRKLPSFSWHRRRPSLYGSRTVNYDVSSYSQSSNFGSRIFLRILLSTIQFFSLAFLV